MMSSYLSGVAASVTKFVLLLNFIVSVENGRTSQDPDMDYRLHTDSDINGKMRRKRSPSACALDESVHT